MKDLLLEHVENCVNCPVPRPGMYIPVQSLCEEGQRIKWQQWDKAYGYSETSVV